MASVDAGHLLPFNIWIVSQAACINPSPSSVQRKITREASAFRDTSGSGALFKFWLTGRSAADFRRFAGGS